MKRIITRKFILLTATCCLLSFVFFIPNVLADSIGQIKNFNVDSSYDYYKRSNMPATLRYVGNEAYFYIEDKWWNELSSYKRIKAENILKELAGEFDRFIYPELTEFFGDVWSPGIDNDIRITILISKLKSSAGGYFDSCHEYSRSQCSRSNEREMIYVNADFLFENHMKGFIAHELQHLISWNRKERIAGLKEDVWLNELRSEYIPALLNYNQPYSESILEMRVKNFLDNPSNPSGEWGGESGDYGVITLLGHYLANQFGENLFSSMSKNPFIGIVSINQAIKNAGYAEDFDEVFINWTLANYYNNLSMGRGSKYGYTTSDLKQIRVSPLTITFNSYSSVNFTESVKDWSPRWYLLKNNLSSAITSLVLKIEFESSNIKSDFRIPYMIDYKDGHHDLGFVNLENQTGTAYIFNFAKDVDSILVVPTNHSKTADFSDNDPATIFSLKVSTVLVNQPVITSIFPSSGPPSGGNTVIIKGGNFQQGIEVFFGGEKASDITFIDETSLKVVVPSHVIGPVNVWVKNPNGKSTVFAQGYEYKTASEIADGSLIRAEGDYRVYIIKDGYRRHILDGRIFDFYGHLNWGNIIQVTPEVRDSYKDSYWVRADGDKKVYEVNGDKSKHWLNMTAEHFFESGRRWEGVFIINNRERDFYRTGVDVLSK